MTPENEESGQLPGGIAERLRQRDRAVSALTPEIDRLVLRAASAHFASRTEKTRHSRARHWLPAAALAASLVVAVLVYRLPGTTPAGQTGLYGDVDGSGHIDIVDVLVLARSRHNGGKVSQADINAFANRIVSLSRNGDRS